MIEFDIKSSLSSSLINPDFFVDPNTAQFEDETGRSLLSQYTYESAILNITRFVNRENLRINESIDNPVLVFQYCIAGQMKLYELDDGTNALAGGNCLISVLKDHNSVGFNRNCRNSIVSILVPLKYALKLIDEKLIGELLDLSQVSNRSIELSPFLPKERIILSEIIDPPVTGNVKNIFIESKMLELIATRLSFYHVKTTTNRKPRTLTLRKEELERIRFAGDIMTERMDDPPTISGLARISGINEFKLKSGFKAVFGSTVYEYLRAIRMERAYALLRNEEMNVSEAAYHVGYNKPSHFTKLFRTYYGINPSQINKKNN